MTSSGHVTSSVTIPFDSAWPLSYRLPISRSFRDNCNAPTHDVSNTIRSYTPQPSAGEFRSRTRVHDIRPLGCVKTDTATTMSTRTCYLGGKSGLTDTVCWKRLLHMVGFLRPSATTSGWTTFPTSYCNCAIQDGVQDGRRILNLHIYHQLLFYFRA